MSLTSRKLKGMYSLLEWWAENENHQENRQRCVDKATAVFDADTGIDRFEFYGIAVIIRIGNLYYIDAQANQKVGTYGASRLDYIISHFTRGHKTYIIHPSMAGQRNAWRNLSYLKDFETLRDLKVMDSTIFKEVYELEQHGVTRYITNSWKYDIDLMHHVTDWHTEPYPEILNLVKYGKKELDVTMPDKILQYADDENALAEDLFNKTTHAFKAAFRLLQRVMLSKHDTSCFLPNRHLNVRKYDMPPAFLLQYKREGKKEYWVLGIDDGSYYCSQIPKPKTMTITGALKAFKPASVKHWEEVHNRTALRQGEWYFMPELLVTPTILKKASWDTLPYETGGNPHKVKLMRFEKSRNKFACGTVRHSQHPMLRLPENWLCRYAKNTSKRDFSLSLRNVD